MDEVAAARIQIFRDRAAVEIRLKVAAKSETAKRLHELAAQQWLQIADIAEGLEKRFPDRLMNRTAERVDELRARYAA